MKNRSTTIVIDKYRYGEKAYSKAIAKIKTGEPIDLVETRFFPSYRSAAAWILKHRNTISKAPSVTWRIGDRLGDILAYYDRYGDNARNRNYWMTEEFFDFVKGVYDSEEHKKLDAEYMAPLH